MAYNVLIVDDSKTTRTIIAKALRHGGVPLGEVHEAADGFAALELLESTWVDIVFADLNMPNMSGVELVERMAAERLLASVPVVIVSTEGRQDRIDALTARGIAAYVRKPFSPEQLAQTAESLLSDEVPVVSPAVLEEAFFQAVEGFAMLVAEPLVATPPAPATSVIARMGFNGPGGSGEVCIAMSEAGSVLIAETAMGESDASAGRDALRELLNVVCGHMVDTVCGGPFVLTTPQTQVVDGPSAWDELAAWQPCLAFDLEGVHTLVAVSVAARKRAS